MLLDTEKNVIKKEIYKITSKAHDNSISVIKNHVDKWEELSFYDKQAVVDALIQVIYISGDKNRYHLEHINYTIYMFNYVLFCK